VSVTELKEGLERGRVREAFGAGTAAVIPPIKAIGIDGIHYPLAIVAEGVALWAGRDQPRGRSILEAEALRSGMTGMIQVRAWPFIFDRYSLSKK